MTEGQAIQIKREIEAVLNRHKLFYSVTNEIKNGDLKFIRFNDIVLKIFEGIKKK